MSSSKSSTSAAAVSAREKLAKLREQREEAGKANRSDALEEDRRMKQDPREDGRKARLVKQALELKQQEEVEEQGKDYKRFKAMEKNVEQAEWERNKREEARQRQVNGFTSFEDVAQRKFDRLTKQIKPDMVAYTQQKLEQGDDFYRDSNSLVYGQYDKVDPERLEAMVQDLKKQADAKKRRVKAEDPNADVDYINDSNKRFNKSISRAFDAYTHDIKDNLERGTAL